MAKINTEQIRIFSEGKFNELKTLIEDQFQKKHGFTPNSKEICEIIARAVEDNKLFYKK